MQFYFRFIFHLINLSFGNQVLHFQPPFELEEEESKVLLKIRKSFSTRSISKIIESSRDNYNGIPILEESGN